MNTKVFLLLQGICSPFFRDLALHLRAAGHTVYKLNFNAGDDLYWRMPAWHYRGDVNDLGDYLAHKYQQFSISDIVVFGDCRPVHLPAIALAKQLGIEVHAFEEGYFRPHWITLERGGVNANSMLPRDADWYWQVGQDLLAQHSFEYQMFRTKFKVRSVHDVAYHLAGCWNPILYPGYQTHAPVIAPIEYAGFLRRNLLAKINKKTESAKIAQLLHSTTPFYLMPLQLNSDAQIRQHSQFEHMQQFILHVMQSFARHAPSDSLLVIKNHPLDYGLENYADFVAQAAAQFDVAQRIVYLEGGVINYLIERASGMVTVNSTAGSLAIELGCPTITLSNPIYNVAGLTFQGALDDFWANGIAPSTELFARFRATIMQASQVNGGFYCNESIQLAMAASTAQLSAERSALAQLIEKYPLNTVKENLLTQRRKDAEKGRVRT
ncbi:capsule biosynthesis protein [Deefgea piscis]|uniref:capsule biosynthesis protein n=1 Tax=Deefgea piscis TaxID=2739061 RepID=UPI001C805E0F|nr:capsular biosynthesis protein [Deefgea piscis]QZA81261.1 capsular biosynthesis protein [Deefgea piscis]